MIIKAHLESFWAKFEPTSLLTIFHFRSTFWLKWDKIWLDMVIWAHLDSFWVKFEPTSLWTVFHFWSTFWQKRDKIWLDMIIRARAFGVILRKVRTDFTFDHFHFWSTFWLKWDKYDLIWLFGPIWSHFQQSSNSLLTVKLVLSMVCSGFPKCHWNPDPVPIFLKNHVTWHGHWPFIFLHPNP